jgi:tetratricopeptide (TPR) repeat protein
MSHRAVVTILALAMTGLFDHGLLAIRNKPKQESGTPKTSADASAADSLNGGFDRLAKAERIEQTNPKQARREYEGAIKDFQNAVRLAPDNYRAHNGLGYSQRKVGNYELALESYERALKLAPNFSDAIEYRAEAYLELNRLDEAKQSYMHLFVHDRKNANVLMKAMKVWVEKRRAASAGIDPRLLSDFEDWVRERDTLAASILNLGHNSPDWK